MPNTTLPLIFSSPLFVATGSLARTPPSTGRRIGAAIGIVLRIIHLIAKRLCSDRRCNLARVRTGDSGGTACRCAPRDVIGVISRLIPDRFPTLRHQKNLPPLLARREILIHISDSEIRSTKIHHQRAIASRALPGRTRPRWPISPVRTCEAPARRSSLR